MSDEGLYIYCIASGERDETLEVHGMGEILVEGISTHGFLAIVEACDPKAFETTDKDLLKDRLLIHHRIVDFAWERYETVVPIGFGTVICPTNGKSSRQNLEEWLVKEAKRLNRKLVDLANKAEYGVQILWEPSQFLPRVREQFEEIRKLEEEIQSQPDGVAYLLRKKLEDLVKHRLETLAEDYFKVFYKEIGEAAKNICVQKIRKETESAQMLLNISCLQKKGAAEALGVVLDKIGQMNGFEVRFTGPWPPYSFANS